MWSTQTTDRHPCSTTFTRQVATDSILSWMRRVSSRSKISLRQSQNSKMTSHLIRSSRISGRSNSRRRHRVRRSRRLSLLLSIKNSIHASCSASLNATANNMLLLSKAAISMRMRKSRMLKESIKMLSVHSLKMINNYHQ
jgi:hypothetical protein